LEFECSKVNEGPQHDTWNHWRRAQICEVMAMCDGRAKMTTATASARAAAAAAAAAARTAAAIFSCEYPWTREPGVALSSCLYSIPVLALRELSHQ